MTHHRGDETMEHDLAHLTQLYRAAVSGKDQPSPKIDAIILAAAQKALLTPNNTNDINDIADDDVRLLQKQPGLMENYRGKPAANRPFFHRISFAAIALVIGFSGALVWHHFGDRAPALFAGKTTTNTVALKAEKALSGPADLEGFLYAPRSAPAPAPSILEGFSSSVPRSAPAPAPTFNVLPRSIGSQPTEQIAAEKENARKVDKAAGQPQYRAREEAPLGLPRRIYQHAPDRLSAAASSPPPVEHNRPIPEHAPMHGLTDGSSAQDRFSSVEAPPPSAQPDWPAAFPDVDGIAHSSPAQKKRDTVVAYPSERANDLSSSVRKELDAAASVGLENKTKSAQSIYAKPIFGDRVNSPPTLWLEEIAAMQRQGKLEQARDHLRRFRERYPNYSIPVELRELLPPGEKTGPAQ